MPKSYSFDSTLLQVVSPDTPNQTFVAQHAHNRTPVEAFILDRTDGAMLYRAFAPWTKTTITLKATKANTLFTLLLIGSGIQPGPSGLSTPVTRSVNLAEAAASRIGGFFAWADTFNDVITFLFPVPPDWLSGNLTVKIMISGGNGPAGRVTALRRDVYRLRNSTAVLTIDNQVNMNFTSFTDVDAHLLATITIVSSNFVVGDSLQVTITRLGNDASDTEQGNLTVRGAWLEYTSNVHN